jgi:hypothetical protein
LLTCRTGKKREILFNGNIEFTSLWWDKKLNTRESERWDGR